MLIPRVIHQIWLGPNPLPDDHRRYQQTWLEHHPGWKLRFWTETNLPGDLRRPEAAERLRVPAERSDILRLELLWREGGVYVDTDFECKRSIEPLIEGADFFIGLAKPGRVNNALLGSVARHPLLDHALTELRPREFYGHDKAGTGPKFLDAILADRHEHVLFLAPELLYPQTTEAAQAAYGIHHEARTWKEPELLRIDLERADRRTQEAREKAESWRARYEAAKAEIEKLQRSWGARAERLLRHPLETLRRKAG